MSDNPESTFGSMLLFSLAIVESDGRSGAPGDAGHRPRAATHQPADRRQPSGWPLFNRGTASAPACDAPASRREPFLTSE